MRDEKKNGGYYEIAESDPEELIAQKMSLDDIFFLRDLQQRKLFINMPILPETIYDAVHHILQINREDAGIPVEERKPILLYLSSRGGDLDAGFELLDVIQSSKTPVYTINFGYQYSMGFLIGIAGHRRFASRNAKFLIHDGNSIVWDSGAKAQDRMEFNKRVEARVRDYILSVSRLSPEEYDANYRVEWYMFADEAKEKGFVDEIIGQDCDLCEIV